MSVKQNPKRGKWEVRWLEGGRHRSRLFERKGDADAFDREIKRRKQLGTIAPEVIQSRLTLAQFIEDDWWPRYAIPNLAADTRRRYLEVIATHLLPRVGDYELRQFTPRLVEDLRDQLVKAGVGDPTVIKTLTVLQGVMTRAVVHQMIPTNPVAAVAKPRQRAGALPQPLAPETVERIRAHMLTMWSSQKRGAGRSADELRWWRERNATIVSVLAYAGLRPAEDRATRWGDIEDRNLHVVSSKTGRPRNVDLLAPLAQDLARWRLLCGRPGDKHLIFPTVDGDDWKRHDWNNWRRRVYQPAAVVAGVTGDMRPYRLRGSFASLLLWEGRSLAHVSEQTGHSIATLVRYYAGTIKELEHKPRVPAAEAIWEAREAVSSSRVATGLRRPR